MNNSILPLTPSVMQEQLAAFLEMDSSTIASERWGRDHFMADLPGKWECSRIVLDGDKPVGFMIATFKNESVHINRFAVDPRYQGVGIATSLLQFAAECAQLNRKKFVTLKVSPRNRKAIEFYQHRGFYIENASGSNVSLYIEAEVLLMTKTSDP